MELRLSMEVAIMPSKCINSRLIYWDIPLRRRANFIRILRDLPILMA